MNGRASRRSEPRHLIVDALRVALLGVAVVAAMLALVAFDVVPPPLDVVLLVLGAWAVPFGVALATIISLAAHPPNLRDKTTPVRLLLLGQCALSIVIACAAAWFGYAMMAGIGGHHEVWPF